MTKTKSPPGAYTFHPATEVYDIMKGPELRALAEDIKTNGQKLPVIHVQRSIIDGRNRYLACRLAGVKCQFEECYGLSEEDIPAHVESLNEHRRHLSPEDLMRLRQERIARVAAARQSGRSLRVIAEAEGVSSKTIQRDLANVEGQPDKVTGADGKEYKAKRGPRPERPSDYTILRLDGLLHLCEEVCADRAVMDGVRSLSALSYDDTVRLLMQAREAVGQASRLVHRARADKNGR